MLVAKTGRVAATILTDHMSLLHTFTRETNVWFPPQHRHLSAISEFNCLFRHLPGRKNPAADVLSRVERCNSTGIQLQPPCQETATGPETTAARTLLTALQWKDIPHGVSGSTILWDGSTWRPRPWPSRLRPRPQPVTSYMTSNKTTANLEVRVSRHLATWITGFGIALPDRNLKFTDTASDPFISLRDERFPHIQVYIVSLLPLSAGLCYLFTIIDSSTRWPKAVPMPDATSAFCSAALLSGWIAISVISEYITFNDGTAFTSQLWTSLGKLLGTTVYHTTAYNSETNGMVERFHGTLNASLMSRCNNSS